jgi:hypothetical protein
MKNTRYIARLSVLGSLLVAAALLNGCASGKSEAQTERKGYKGRQYAAEATKVKFGEFKRVELKSTTIAPEYRKKKANQVSAQKIDEMLQQQLKYVFPDLHVIPPGGEFSQSGERTLQISPTIEVIKLVSVGSRVMWGAMAGGSDIVMNVTYRDSSTGEVIANPDFWRGNNAWAGGTSWGQADNEIRDAVVTQIINYTQANK